ncbi:hypothetical protein [uncultured Dokdonia sp.]|nr:hypothetical protein [uncultured Dokdonia sp.]
MKNLIISLVKWGMDVIIIGVFAVVCIVMALIVFNLSNSNKKEDDTSTN